MRMLLACLSAAALVLAASFSAGCGGAHTRAGGVTIEAIPPTATAALTLIGGKPEAPPPTAEPGDGTPTAEGIAASATQDLATPDDASPPAEATSAPIAPTVAGPSGSAPQQGRWLDVDVTQFIVRLMDGQTVVREIAPVAVGEQIDTGAYASTQTGLFHVYSKVEGLAYDPPYNTYISHWVAFDRDKANGFHSFLKDKGGNVVDPATGRVSNGCIRTGAPETIFGFAEIGMPVWVHI